MKVAIELMSMHSAPGYVPSSGYTLAILVKAEDAATCAGDKTALFDLDGQRIYEEALADVQQKRIERSVLTYDYVMGMFDVPDGFVVVQQHSEDICTNDQPFDNAWIVNPESLVDLYRERAKCYTELAEITAQFVAKKVGFAEFKAAVRAL